MSAIPFTSADLQSAIERLKTAQAVQVQNVMDQANALKQASDIQVALLAQDYANKEASLIAEQEAWRAAANGQIATFQARAEKAEAALNALAAEPATTAGDDPLNNPAIRAALFSLAQERLDTAAKLDVAPASATK